MMRLIVSVASSVCRVEKTRWPVSAARSAVSIVSKSRISPTRMTSGSCRSALRSACANDRVSTDDLALVDERQLIAVEELDRILDGHHVRRPCPIDVVDERGQRGALAAAGRAGDEDEPALLGGDLLQNERQPELVDGPDLHRDDAEDQADGAALLEDVAAEPAEAGHAVGEVHFLRFLEALTLRGGHDRRAHRDDVLVIQPLFLGRPA